MADEKTNDGLTVERMEDGIYKLSFPWPAPHPPATYAIEAREVGSDRWLDGPSYTAKEAFWRAPWESKAGWEVRVSGQTKQDGRYRSETVVLQNV